MNKNMHDTRKHKQTILIVEDDEATGEVMELAIMQETSYHVVVARSGMEALKAVQHWKPDLFILDYQLPDITGIELYDRFHEIEALVNVPTLLVSATKRRADIEPRAVMFIDKPFELDEFLQTISYLIA